MALTDQLTAIGNAIRSKTGGTALIDLDDMPTAILNIPSGGFPTVVFSDVLSYLDYNGAYDWLFTTYKNNVSTQNVTDCSHIFENSGMEDLSDLTLNFNSNSSTIPFGNGFTNCNSLKVLPSLGRSITIALANNLFQKCYLLREIGNEWSTKVSFANDNKSKASMFSTCTSLRQVPQSWLNNISNTNTAVLNGVYYGMFEDCHSMDDITNLNAITTTYTSNAFQKTFDNCCRAKRITFITDNGTPYVRSWKTQTIDLSKNVGYLPSPSWIGQNSGITADKEVTDATSYNTLKNDPDWFATQYSYCRYNHDSAVETINSLPDTSAYLATAGGTNTIKFKGASGSATDGGAINTLTTAEIAVATSKGWTVTLV